MLAYVLGMVSAMVLGIEQTLGRLGAKADMVLAWCLPMRRPMVGH